MHASFGLLAELPRPSSRPLSSHTCCAIRSAMSARSRRAGTGVSRAPVDYSARRPPPTIATPSPGSVTGPADPAPAPAGSCVQPRPEQLLGLLVIMLEVGSARRPAARLGERLVCAGTRRSESSQNSIRACRIGAVIPSGVRRADLEILARAGRGATTPGVRGIVELPRWYCAGGVALARRVRPRHPSWSRSRMTYSSSAYCSDIPCLQGVSSRSSVPNSLPGATCCQRPTGSSGEHPVRPSGVGGFSLSRTAGHVPSAGRSAPCAEVAPPCVDRLQPQAAAISRAAHRRAEPFFGRERSRLPMR